MPSKKEQQGLQKYKDMMSKYTQRDIDSLDEGNREIWDEADLNIKNGVLPSRDIQDVFRVLEKNKQEKQQSSDEQQRLKVKRGLEAGRDAAKEKVKNIVEPLLVQLKNENNGEIPDTIESEKVNQYAREKINPTLDVKAAEQKLQQLDNNEKSGGNVASRRPGVVDASQHAGVENGPKTAGEPNKEQPEEKNGEQPGETDELVGRNKNKNKKPMSEHDKQNIIDALRKLSDSDLYWLSTELKKEAENVNEAFFNKRKHLSKNDAVHSLARKAKELGIPPREVISAWETEARGSTDVRELQGILRVVANRHGKNIASASSKEVKVKKHDKEVGALAKSILNYSIKYGRSQDVLDIMKDSGLESNVLGNVGHKLRKFYPKNWFGESLNEFAVSRHVVGQFLSDVADAAGVKKAGEAPQESDTDENDKNIQAQESLRVMAEILDSSSDVTKQIMIECAIQWCLDKSGNHVNNVLTESVSKSPVIEERYFDFVNEMMEEYGVMWGDFGIRPLYENGNIVLKKKININETISSELLDRKIDVISLKKVLSLISDHNMAGNLSLIRKSIFSKLRDTNNIESKTLRYIGDELVGLANKGIDISQAFNV